MAMIATTIISSIRVKPFCMDFFICVSPRSDWNSRAARPVEPGPVGSRATPHVPDLIRRRRAKPALWEPSCGSLGAGHRCAAVEGMQDDAARHFMAKSDKFWIWGLPGGGRSVMPIRPAVQPAVAPDERADREYA